MGMNVSKGLAVLCRSERPHWPLRSAKPDSQLPPTFLPFRAGNVDPAGIANFSAV
jgi:hypothetical protein